MTPESYYKEEVAIHGVAEYITSDEDLRDPSLLKQVRAATGFDIPDKSNLFGPDLYNICLQLLITTLPPEARKKVEGRVHAGVFPTGKYNAEAKRLPDKSGYVFFLNVGLTQLIYATVKLIMSRARYAQFGEDGEPMPETAEGESLLSHDQAAVQFRWILQRYLALGRLKLGGILPLPMIPPAKSNLALPIGSLVAWAECFVLAHELAHAVLGHLDRDSDSALAVGAGKTISVISKSQEEEIQADLLAIRMIMEIAPSCPYGPFTRVDNIDEKLLYFTLQSSLAGPLLFFEIGRHLEPLQQAVPSTHPTCAFRTKLLRAYLLDIGVNPTAFSLGDVYLNVLKAFAS